jgi:hypothetical protein
VLRAQNAERFLARVLANSFVGRIGDPTDPESLTDENLSRLAGGLLQGLAHIRKRDRCGLKNYRGFASDRRRV